MELKKLINIEDNAMKHSKLNRELKRNRISEVFWAKDAKSGIEEIERAAGTNEPYDLLICDMHFDFYGDISEESGRKTFEKLSEKGINIPVIYFSSINVKIPGAVGNVWFREDKDWEGELRKMLEELRKGN